MIDLPATFKSANKKKNNTPAIIAEIVDTEAFVEKTTVSDWGNNTTENNITYINPISSVWVCDNATNSVYRVNTDGSIISSFPTTGFDASATDPRGIFYDNNTQTYGLLTGRL